MLTAHARKYVAYTWLGFAGSGLIFFALHPQLLQPDQLQAFFAGFDTQTRTVYVLVSLLKGFLLVPTIPFAVVGALLFPEDAWFVFGVSISGMLVSATFLYFFADNIGLGAYLEQKYPKKLATCTHYLNKPYAVLLVIAWAFFPAVPTDLVCYIARLVGMNFWLMLAGILIGEGGLIIACIWLV